ncbi:Hypothetical_protein [Hexamita inflata]|uniref:Hypothetical_protein n=1 Tax=Hexamita inflata TaxID=28002 RepID=A0AA86TT82_9EUKA|nr:Hypothetical protein HINF_LOCUS15135 [Hexamita inflata]
MLNTDKSNYYDLLFEQTSELLEIPIVYLLKCVQYIQQTATDLKTQVEYHFFAALNYTTDIQVPFVWQLTPHDLINMKTFKAIAREEHKYEQAAKVINREKRALALRINKVIQDQME